LIKSNYTASGVNQFTKWLLVLYALTMVTGCMIGRSWDTPGIYTGQHPLPKLTGLTLYVDGETSIIESALNPVHRDEVGDFKVVYKREDVPQNTVPILKIQVISPGWRYNNWLANISSALSTITFSILPGYMYKASEVSFQLTLPDKFGKMVTINRTYAAKRHYVSWLPLWVGYNFVQTVQVFTEPTPDWYQGRERLVLQFFRETKPAIDEYRAWLENQLNERGDRNIK
jgi:hypothetical protein